MSSFFDNNDLKDFYIELGKRISKFRKEQKLTQAELAKELGVRQQLIASYELSRRKIPLIFIIPLSKALYVSIEDLLGIENNKAKRGPIPKIQIRLEKIKNLPVNKQKLILDSLDTMIKGAKQ